MAATLLARGMMPLPTPISTIMTPPFRVLGRQFSNTTVITLGGPTTEETTAEATTTAALAGPSKCSNFDATQTCSSKGDYGSCLARSGEAYCRCNNGVQYLRCVSSAIATSSCSGIVQDWDSFETSWLLGSCSAPPSSVMVQLPQPTTVTLSLAPVTLTTPPAPITQLPPPVVTSIAYQPSSGGKLLEGDCSSTSFSMVDAGDMVFYAPIVGCNAARPECCPWVASGKAMATATGPSEDQINRVAAAAGQFPKPENGQLSLLPKCPNDYYSVSGLCCPNGYFKFTRPVASQTPCFSSLSAAAIPPVVTVGDPGVPTDTNRPTSALVNIAMAMSYDVEPEPSSSGLSKGAVIGIGIGSGILFILLAALAACLILRARKNRRRRQPVPQSVQENPFADAPGFGGGVVDPSYAHGGQGMTYKSGYHAPPGSPPPVPSRTGGGPSQGPGMGGYAPTVSSARYTPTVVSAAYSDLPGGQSAQVQNVQHQQGQQQFGNSAWAESGHGQAGYGGAAGGEHTRGYSEGAVSGHSRGYSGDVGQAGYRGVF
ncbi:hypothetical protein QBC42DRAFT_298538 [Cladorrhinum samala]|uniref:Uncharacterized protein n=1 Tax=Cladorrhinum samala TaxID=585594 RepID=A0AAV9HIS2_9PEZI|nr:hypothetical protein QBC42DRAFT_298538 [Cladorrhinum samala]